MAGREQSGQDLEFLYTAWRHLICLMLGSRVEGNETLACKIYVRDRIVRIKPYM